MGQPRIPSILTTQIRSYVQECFLGEKTLVYNLTFFQFFDTGALGEYVFFLWRDVLLSFTSSVKTKCLVQRRAGWNTTPVTGR